MWCGEDKPGDSLSGYKFVCVRVSKIVMQQKINKRKIFVSELYDKSLMPF